MDVIELRKKALNVVEADMKRYQEAEKTVAEWTDKECSCAIVLHRFCSRCSQIHTAKSMIDGIRNKYWHG